MKKVIGIFLLATLFSSQAQAVSLDGDSATHYINDMRVAIDGLATIAVGMCERGVILREEFEQEITPVYMRLYNKYYDIRRGSYGSNGTISNDQQQRIASRFSDVQDLLITKNTDFLSYQVAPGSGSYCTLWMP